MRVPRAEVESVYVADGGCVCRAEGESVCVPEASTVPLKLGFALGVKV